MSDDNIHNANRSGGDSKKGLDSMDARDCVIKTRHGTMDACRWTVLMGIINVTPDSFYDGGKRLDPDRAVADGMSMVEAGADILDIGGEWARPGAGGGLVGGEMGGGGGVCCAGARGVWRGLCTARHENTDG